jgi:hypothetical protein
MESTMSNTKHTPTPWRLIEGNLIKQDYRPIGLDDSSGVLIGSVCGHPSSGFYPTEEEGAANAAFIVRACNSHEQLVNGLKNALEDGDNGDWQSARRAIVEALTAAEAA